MKLGQAAIGKALEACQSELEAEGESDRPPVLGMCSDLKCLGGAFAEVLSAYIVNKYQRGSTSPGVLRAACI